MNINACALGEEKLPVGSRATNRHKRPLIRLLSERDKNTYQNKLSKMKYYLLFVQAVIISLGKYKVIYVQRELLSLGRQ